MGGNNRIGIVTLQNGNNYGAMFQIYALTKYLESKGHSVFIVNYCYERDKTKLTKYLRHPLSFIQKILNKKAFNLSFIKQKKRGGNEKQNEQSFDDIFNNFRDNYLKIEGEPSNYKELFQKPPDADIFICGSDQVWADDFFFSSPAFLLGFVPKDSVKIAYAASFGKNKLEPYLHKIFKAHIITFDAISTREKSGVDIVKKITKIGAEQVLDPTLLLDDYSELIDYSLVPDDPYILVYRLSQEYELAKWLSSTVRKISEEIKHPVLSVTTNCPWSLEKNGQDLQPTPGQLLGLIEKSSLFITNSFHGTVFSIILKIKFLAFARDSFENKQNLRMIELLDSLKLESFYCSSFLEEKNIFNKLTQKYDYDKAYRELNSLRNASTAFLDKAIKK